MKHHESLPEIVFSYSFRPLFLLATLHALFGISFWTLAWTGHISVQWQSVSVYWHGHEMLMGLAGAAIGGFLLTAVATWTNRPPVKGLPLILLCTAWLAGRLSLQAPWLTAIADTVYWVGLWLLLANEILSAGNRRNYRILLVLALLALSDAAYHGAEFFYPLIQQQLLWLQLWLVILMIHVIGGRVIPAFTANWLRKQAAPDTLSPGDLPPAFNRLDLAALITLLLFALATVLPLPAALAVPLGALACLMQFWRLARWQFWKTLSEPLVWMLHLAYLWIPLGLGLWTLALAGWIPASAAIHALTIGAIASMIISVGSRAALGHTGRPLQSHPLLTASIVLISLAALLRISAAIAAPQTQTLLGFSAIAWVLGFLCFALRYVPILLLPAQKPGDHQGA